MEQLTSGIWQSFTTGAGKRVWMSEYASGNYDVTDIRTGLDLSTQVCACMQRLLYTSTDADQVPYACVRCNGCSCTCLFVHSMLDSVICHGCKYIVAVQCLMRECMLDMRLCNASSMGAGHMSQH